MGLKEDAVLGFLAQSAEAEDLEAAAVREDGAFPAHKAMQTAGRGDDVHAGSEVEMIGVAQDDFCAHVNQFFGRHGLDRGLGADWHEDRRLHLAVCGCQRAVAG